MNILIIPSWYEINSNPTLGSFFKEQAMALKKEGHNVVVAYPGFLSLKTYGKNRTGIYKYVDNNVNVYRYDTYNYLYDKLNLKAIIFKKKLFRLYKEIIKEENNFDIIHVHSCLWAGYGAVKLGEKYKIPVVLTEHSTAFSNNNISIKSKKYVEYALNNAHKVLSVSQALKNSLNNYCNRDDIEVINNMVDVKFFNISTEAKEFDEDFIFLTVCYLEHKKGLDVLIKAFNEKMKKRNVKLIIGGKGAEENNLKNLVKNLNLEKQVIFLGALTREEVAKEMNKCNVFILPSRHETFGVVFIEALACGKPIIATASGGPNEIVNEKNGLLVEVDNISELGNAMEKIMSNYAMYNNEVIREECINKYSEDSIVKKLTSIYNKIAKI